MRIAATRPSVLGRMWTSAVLVFVAGVAGASGAANAQQLTFTHIAGSAWTGDGGQARPANLTGATDIVFDAAGNMYVSQGSANRIRKITPAGAISTVVGGYNGFGGDGGLASNALINRPTGMEIDAAGNLYFVDSYNRRVRRIGTDGKITTVAGNGIAGYGGDGGAATSAGLGRPWGLAMDKNGNLFVSDVGNGTVRKVTPAGVISRYAGNGTKGKAGDGGPAAAANLNMPYGIDVDGAGNLYIADSYNSSVRRVATNGTISMYRDGFRAYTVHVDAAGHVYFNHDCYILKEVGTTLVAYGSPELGCVARSPDGTVATSAYFGYPDGLAVDAAGNLYFTDADFANVSKVSANGALLTTVAGTKPEVTDGTAATSAVLSNVNYVSVGPDGSIALSDWLSAYRVRSIVGGKVRTLAGTGRLYGSCDYERYSCTSGLEWDMLVSGLAAGRGGVTFVSNRLASGGVQHLQPDTKAITQYAGGGFSMWAENLPATSVQIAVRGIALDDSGNLFLAQSTSGDSRILKVDSQAKISTFAGTGNAVQSGDGGQAKAAGLNLPMHVAVDDAGNVYVWETWGTIRKVARNGVIRRIAGLPNTLGAYYGGEGGNALDATLGAVNGLAAHVSGVYFTSEGKLRRIRADGKIETIPNFPHYAQGVAIRNGYMYVSTERGQIFRAPMPRKQAPADFNGDARSDLLFRSTAGGNLIWLNADSATRQTIATYATENKLVGQGDFNGDGKADVVWRNTSTGANTLWRSGSSTAVTTLTPVADQNWKIAGVGDFNGDRKADLFWHNSLTGANEYWPSGASGSKRAVTALVDTKWVLGGIGDFDGDGKSDLFWRHTVTGKNQVWSAALSSQVVPVTGVTNVAWKVAAIGDFNGDGVSDVVWRDATNGNTALWRSAIYTARQSIVAVTNLQWSIAAAGDFDNDGIDDLVWRNNVTGENTIWKNANNATQKAVSSAGNTWKVQPFEAQP